MFLSSFSHPSSPFHLSLLQAILSLLYFPFDISLWPLPIILTHKNTISCWLIDFSIIFVYSVLIWLASICTMRFILRRALTYTDWMFEKNPRQPSFKTKLWKLCLDLFFKQSKHRKLYDYQKYLPKLPLPNLESIISSYLPTVQLILSEENFSRHKVLAREFYKQRESSYKDRLKNATRPLKIMSANTGKIMAI